MKKTKYLGYTLLAAISSVIIAIALSPKAIVCSGTPDNIQDYNLGGQEFLNLTIKGSYCKVHNFTVRGSFSHGVRVGEWVYAPSITHHVEVYDFSIYDSTTEGLDGGSWGSCLKAETNSHDLYFHDGIVVRCGGEAVGITGAEHVRIERVDVVDGKQAGFYIDNSLDVQLLDTSATCTGDPLYFRSGKPSSAYLFGDEDYAQTLHASKLGDILVLGAESYNCSAMSYWGGQVTPNGIKNMTFAGIFWNSPNTHYIKSGARNSNIDVSGIIYKTGVVITPTVTPTALPVTTTPTIPVPTKTLTPTLPPTKTKTPSPTVTLTPTGCVAGEKSVNLTVQLNTYPKSLNMRENHSQSSKAVGNLYSDPGIRHSIVKIWTDCTNYWGSIGEGHWFALKLNGVYFSDWRP